MRKRLVLAVLVLGLILPVSARRNIMMTGYWEPTSEMIYRFSDDPELNPEGWIGENWEELGYDVYAYFPAFNRVTRDFEVDYQATWEDFWATVEIINPIAIISYGAGVGEWEIEYNARNLASWSNDTEYPYQPTPCPPDSTVAANFVRHSTLPVDEIAMAVNEQTPINAWIDWDGNGGAYLCEYMSYLCNWYQDIHSDLEGEHPCLAAGFIHVSSGVSVGTGAVAAEVTLRETIGFLQGYVDVLGNVYSGEVEPLGTEIVLEGESGSYSAVADTYGEFSFALLPSGNYHITAFLGRYYYYEGEVYLDFEQNELNIEMEEYAPNIPLTWCIDSSQIITAAPGLDIVIAAAFATEDLIAYENCHLRELCFTAPAGSDECDIYMKLYEGIPIENDTLITLYEKEISDHATGEIYNLWLDDITLFDSSTVENGLTLALEITDSNGNIGWMDEGPAVSGRGNLIKVGDDWMEAYEMLGVDANWDLRLGFYGDLQTDTEEDIVETSSRLINYPNPFNPETEIRFITQETGTAFLKIYNIKGELVKKQLLHSDISGRYSWIWHGENEKGSSVSSGVYLARITTEKEEISCKMLLVK